MANSNLLNTLYARMRDEADKSPLQYQLCAAILSNKKIISRPYCNTIINPKIINTKLCGSIHAELNAILHFFGKDKTRHALNKTGRKDTKKNASKYDLIVIRVIRAGQTANARPCCQCLTVMQNIGIRKVYYTSNISNELLVENIKDMVSIQSSTVSKDLYCIRQSIDSNSDVYFKNLLHKCFPKFIKMKSLLYFINYNFINIFPHYKIVIKNNIVTFTDVDNVFVIRSYII